MSEHLRIVMSIAPCAELHLALTQAADIAMQSGQPLSTAHVLLALFTVPNVAAVLLLDRGINEESLLSHLDGAGEDMGDKVTVIMSAASRIAETFESQQLTTLHVLVGLLRTPDTVARTLIERTGAYAPQLERLALHYLDHGVPESVMQLGRGAEVMGELDELVVRDTMECPALPRQGAATPQTVEACSTVRTDTSCAIGSSQERRISRGRRTSDRHAPDPHDRRRADPAPSAPDAAPDAADPTSAPDPASAPDAPAGSVRPEPKPEESPSPFVLNRDKFPWLTKLGRNLTHFAWLNLLDPVLGRDDEIDAIIDILNKRRSNNPCLVGAPGVGKTAVAEGVALHLAHTHGSAHRPPDRVLIQVDVGAIIAGTHLRGALAERLRGLQDEVRTAQGKVVVFIDEIHTLVGGGGGDGAHDAANELKAALARGEFPCIGATTFDEYRKHIEQDPALQRRFTAVEIEAPDAATTRLILDGVVPNYAAHHNVAFSAEALDAAVKLGRRYVHDRHDPDRALNILDLAGAVARRAHTDVSRRTVAEVIARTARVPIEHLMVDDPERFLKMEVTLGEHIVGQDHVLGAMAETIRRNIAGFAGHRPIGSFLLLGPTGVGKTAAVKALAEFLFGSPDAMARFDMSEYLEGHSIARLIGAPPGYVGHEEGGQLTEAMRRRPYQVLLLDEIEKAHRDVWNVLLQVLDEGHITDSRGRKVDLSNAVVVLTSNLGAAAAAATDRRIGFAGAHEQSPEALHQRTLDTAKRAFPPELWNRIERRLVFNPLARADIRRIAHLLIADRAKLLDRERSITFVATDAAVEVLIERGGFDPELGARPMRQAIAHEIEGPIAEMVLTRQVTAGACVTVDATDGELSFAPSS